MHALGIVTPRQDLGHPLRSGAGPSVIPAAWEWGNLQACRGPSWQSLEAIRRRCAASSLRLTTGPGRLFEFFWLIFLL